MTTYISRDGATKLLWRPESGSRPAKLSPRCDTECFTPTDTECWSVSTKIGPQNGPISSAVPRGCWKGSRPEPTRNKSHVVPRNNVGWEPYPTSHILATNDIPRPCCVRPQAIRRGYDEFYIADCGRPPELRTIRVEKAVVLKRHVEGGIRREQTKISTPNCAIYRTQGESCTNCQRAPSSQSLGSENRSMIRLEKAGGDRISNIHVLSSFRWPRWIFSLCARLAKLENFIRAVYSTLPAEVANELAYVPDQMILDFLFIKVTLRTVMDNY